MQLGFGLPMSGSWATPDNIVEIARKSERFGYVSLWTFQRLLVSDARTLPPVYSSVLDPIVALGFAAAVTERVRLGTAVVDAPFLSPAVLGKQLATVDVLSDGRLDAGLGLGWSRDEFDAVGVGFERRGARTEEFVDCLRHVWGSDPVEFDGEFYRVPRSSIRPKPVQQPHPPILLGGGAPAALRRAGRIADGWISSSRADLVEIGGSVEQIRAAARDSGRDPALLRYICRGVVIIGTRTGPLTGTFDDVRGDLAELASQGITETFVDLNFDPSIGNPDADPTVSLRRAHEILEALAPG